MKQIWNPIFPLHEYVPDGEPHVFRDRVYVFGSHDKEGGEEYCMLDYVCYSASVEDLTDWRYEGVIYSPSQDPAYGENRKYIYAPDVVRGNDGRYYLYYCLLGDHYISVAVCDTQRGGMSITATCATQTAVSCVGSSQAIRQSSTMMV